MTPTQIIHEFAAKNLLVEKYLLGELVGADLEDFEQHLFECSICFEAVKAGQVFTENISAGVLPPQASSSMLFLLIIVVIIFVVCLLVWGKV